LYCLHLWSAPNSFFLVLFWLQSDKSDACSYFF
jgi:hypothetical protein